MQNFDAVFTITSGGLGTANLPYTIYQTFYNAHDYGQASAAGVVVVIGTIIIATFALRTVSSPVPRGGAAMTTTAARRRRDRTPADAGAAPQAAPARAARRAGLGGRHRSSSLPVLWMVLTSLPQRAGRRDQPAVVFAPLTLDGYRTFFGAGPAPAPGRR